MFLVETVENLDLVAEEIEVLGRLSFFKEFTPFDAIVLTKTLKKNKVYKNKLKILDFAKL
jgi:hypothetical protein